MDYRELERELYEGRQSDVQKVWVILDNDFKEVADEFDSEELAIKGYNRRLKGDHEANIEIGWIWDTDLCSDYKHVRKCLNPITPEDLKQAV